MILIADSGSTKTDWSLCEGDTTVVSLKSAGMNPYFQTREAMSREIKENLCSPLSDYKIDAIYFYGAGCANDAAKGQVADALSEYFKTHIEAESDLLGAARALCGRKRGIACILGTGSNSCLYDGHTITDHIPPLGFILGDEGSGAYLGKRLVSDCLKHQLSKELEEKFMDQFKLTQAIILDRVYKQPFPSRFLASLQFFLLDNIAEPVIREMVTSSFEAFFTRNVLLYPGAFEMPIRFIGSIAYLYQVSLQEAAERVGVSIGTIMRSPMNGLIRYHAEQS